MKIFKYITLMALFVSLNVMSEGETKDSILTIKGLLIPSGPYDGMWEFTLNEYPDFSGAKIEFSRSVGIESTKFSGSKIINYKSIVSLKSIIEDQGFFELPESILPDAISLHSLDYRLEICRVNKCHKVELYDPDRLLDSKESRRFIIVWDAIMNIMPQWPSNWPEFETKDNSKQ